ncbi:hypothetical protein FQN49_005981 [Arthroderma sp. PD_2]|nr:hypothetical protein FQN49_005981 [Arthroderma sp. PD_2]
MSGSPMQEENGDRTPTQARPEPDPNFPSDYLSGSLSPKPLVRAEGSESEDEWDSVDWDAVEGASADWDLPVSEGEWEWAESAAEADEEDDEVVRFGASEHGMLHYIPFDSGLEGREPVVIEVHLDPTDLTTEDSEPETEACEEEVHA